MKNKNNKYCLSISPNPKYWDLSKPLLFCGEWCINSNNKNLLNKKRYKILDDTIFKKDFNLIQIKQCDQIYETLLEEISIKLNEIHKINWSKKAWRIVIGPWLNRYIAIINNRLNLIVFSSKENEIFFKDLDFGNNSLISFDIRDFTDKAVSHEWNEKLIRRLYLFYSSQELNLEYLDDIKFEHFKKEKDKNNFQNFLKCKFNLLLKNLPFSKSNEFFFHKIYLGSYITSLKLFLGLKNFPVKYFISEKRFKFNFDIKMRKKFQINFKVQNLNEKIIRFLLQETLPTIYLEGFKEVFKSINKTNLPNSPKKIFTSNCSQDSIFKFWLANAVNSGSKLIHGQHGAAYGMIIEHSNLKYELSICDKYISWGWLSKIKFNEKILQGVALPIIKKRAIKRKHYENILIIPTVIDHYIFKNELRRTDKMNQDLAIVDNLINNLDEKLKKKLIFKPHPIEIRKKKEFSYYNYFKNNHPHIQLYNHKEKLDELINKSQLSIFLYLATPFLENLALNKPSIMIYHSGFEETLNDEAKIYFKYLSDSKIVFTSVVEAIKFLNENGNDRIEQWWNSKDTQFARNKFSKYYVNKDKNSLKTLINCLKNS